MKLIGEIMTQLETPQALWAFVYKMAARGHFVFPIDAKNHKVLVIWDLDGYGEYEFDWCILWQSYGLYKRWRAAAETAAETAAAAVQPKTKSPEIFKFRGCNNNDTKLIAWTLWPMLCGLGNIRA